MSKKEILVTTILTFGFFIVYVIINPFVPAEATMKYRVKAGAGPLLMGCLIIAMKLSNARKTMKKRAVLNEAYASNTELMP